MAALLALTACDLGRVTVGTTAKVLRRAQPAIRMESDYDLAARAIPGALKTVEGFWVVAPDNENLIAILTEGFCQYGLAFVQDEWEQATFAGDLEAVAHLNGRATKIFTRCLNYALRSLGDKWQRDIFGTPEQVELLCRSTGADRRDPLMWAAIALGSIINHNLDNIEIVAQVSTVKRILARVLELDAAQQPKDRSFRALPYVALGQIESASTQTGDVAKAKQYFEQAIALTTVDGQELYLLPRTIMAYRVGRLTRDRALYHQGLVKVLETAPSVWPEQRLANEVAHRRARRYLKLEKELF
ncbi:MAG: TRAP transporter TatT component family protein [Kofleriaceae bacterium]